MERVVVPCWFVVSELLFPVGVDLVFALRGADLRLLLLERDDVGTQQLLLCQARNQGCKEKVGWRSVRVCEFTANKLGATSRVNGVLTSFLVHLVRTAQFVDFLQNLSVLLERC